MNAVADEMRLSKEKRRTSVVTTILHGIKNLADTTVSLGPMLTGVFS
jgi:hypothetical protein